MKNSYKLVKNKKVSEKIGKDILTYPEKKRYGKNFNLTHHQEKARKTKITKTDNLNCYGVCETIQLSYTV